MAATNTKKGAITLPSNSSAAQTTLLSTLETTEIMANTSLKLVGPAAFRAFRCIWMLEELGVSYEHVAAKPWSKLAKTYHPQGKIPVLLDGDFVLYESVAINTYLGDKFQSPLVPSSTQERALYNQFTLAILADMDTQGLWMHRKHEALSEYFGECPIAVKEAKRQFDKVQSVLVSQLSKPGPYLLGGDFTAVDILYVHCLIWASDIGWFKEPTGDKGGDDALSHYLSLCKSRPAYKRAIAIRNAEADADKMKKSKM